MRPEAVVSFRRGHGGKSASAFSEGQYFSAGCPLGGCWSFPSISALNAQTEVIGVPNTKEIPISRWVAWGLVLFLSSPAGAQISADARASGLDLPGQQPADLIFNVPVDVQNLHQNVIGIGVSCVAAHAEYDIVSDSYFTSYTPLGVQSNLIGFRTTEIMPMPDGDYSGTVTVAFGTNPGRQPSDADYYLCGLNLYTADGSIHAIEGQVGVAAVQVTDENHPNYEGWLPAEGTVFVPVVSGSLGTGLPGGGGNIIDGGPGDNSLSITPNNP